VKGDIRGVKQLDLEPNEYSVVRGKRQRPYEPAITGSGFNNLAVLACVFMCIWLFWRVGYPIAQKVIGEPVARAVCSVVDCSLGTGPTPPASAN
jgi:hypothetical protein